MTHDIIRITGSGVDNILEFFTHSDKRRLRTHKILNARDEDFFESLRPIFDGLFSK